MQDIFFIQTVFYKGQDCIYQKEEWTEQKFQPFVSPGGQGNGQPT